MIYNPTDYLNNLRPAPGYFYDQQRAENVCNWFERYLTCTSAEWFGEPFKLIWWQRKILSILYGFVHEETGFRQYTRVFVFVPKKNGKTELSSGIGVFQLIADGEKAPEVYSIATDYEQAKLSWDGTKNMIENNEMLRKHSGLYHRHNPIRIESPKNSGKFRPLSSSAKGKQGLRPSTVICDEMHEWRNRVIYDGLTHPNATMSRRQPIIFIITTAGEQEDHICNEVHAYAVSIQQGEVTDHRFLPAVWGIDDKEDWTDPKVHAAVNPSWGITIQPQVVKEACEKAQKTEAEEVNFKRWTCNLFVRKLSRKWIPMDDWDICAIDRTDENQEVMNKMFQTHEVYAGLDFAPKNDLTSLALVCKDRERDLIYIQHHTWVTQVEADRKTHAEGIPFDKWIENGWLEATPVKVFDPTMLRMFLRTLLPEYPMIKVLGYDANRIGAMMQKFDEEDEEAQFITCVDIPNTCRSLNEATTTLYNYTLNQKIQHFDDPLLRYCALNAHVHANKEGLVKPDKSLVQYKIDPIMAIVMAIDCMIREENEEEEVENIPIPIPNVSTPTQLTHEIGRKVSPYA